MMIRIFISSVQKELAAERRAIKDFIRNDPLLGRFIGDVFLFEDIPACDRKPDDIYLGEVEERDIYLAMLGNRYGSKNAEGKSPTELEFDHATRTHRERLVFVKGDDDISRDPEMAKLVGKATRHVTRRRFTDIPGLVGEVYASLVESLEKRGALLTRPFDDSLCDGATLRDIDNEQVTSFVETAEAKGRLALKGSRAPKAVLRNFNLLKGDKPTNAAMLLFGKNPRRFFSNIQVHCFHFHGTEKRKPIASQQPYEGRLFEVIDEAVEFVLGKLDRSVGTRAKSAQAPVEFEIPRPVITEAIVNAVAHRNYRHNGFVQVIVYADRVEVWNPGELPPGLTPELLREPHGPIPRNPLIAEPLFRVKYVEKAGTGTTDMIAECRAAGLPEPDFRQCGPHFVTTLWRPKAKVIPGVGAKYPASTRQVPAKYPASARQVLATLAAADQAVPRAVLQNAAQLHDREHFAKEHLQPLLTAGLIEMTIPDKPRSSKQKYRLTDKGRAILKEMGK
jgi:predicted HTH transcriptional regulator